MVCPYCKVRKIEVTLTDIDGTYSMCFNCSMQWGLKAQAPIARCQVRELEHWYSLPDAKDVR
jgi:hypothetical protein